MGETTESPLLKPNNPISINDIFIISFIRKKPAKNTLALLKDRDGKIRSIYHLSDLIVHEVGRIDQTGGVYLAHH